MNKNVKKGTISKIIERKKRERSDEFEMKHQTIHHRIVCQKMFHTHCGRHGFPLGKLNTLLCQL